MKHLITLTLTVAAVGKNAAEALHSALKPGAHLTVHELHSVNHIIPDILPGGMTATEVMAQPQTPATNREATRRLYEVPEGEEGIFAPPSSIAHLMPRSRSGMFEPEARLICDQAAGPDGQPLPCVTSGDMILEQVMYIIGLGYPATGRAREWHADIIEAVKGLMLDREELVERRRRDAKAAAAMMKAQPDQINAGDLTSASHASFSLVLSVMKLIREKPGRDVVAWREGWNGKCLRIKCQYPDDMSKMTLPYIYLEYPDGVGRVPWVASQTDIFAQDWCYEIVPASPNKADAPAPREAGPTSAP